MRRTPARATILTALTSLVAALVVPLAVAPSAKAETVYTLQDVQKHGTPADCWSIVDTSVYDLTGWINRHEGGPTVIKGMCGIDATASFLGAHGPGQKSPGEAARALSRMRIGAYDTASANFADTTTYTPADVAKHSSSTDCWSIVSAKVYKLTNWVTTHPGGSAPIIAMCGRDGTAMYTGKHGTSASAAGALKGMQIGVIAPGSVVTPTTNKTYTMKQVRRHKTAASCWTVVGKSVYDVTAWIPQHPGGRASILAMCGKKATTLFRAQHGSSASAKGTLRGFKIGKVR